MSRHKRERPDGLTGHAMWMTTCLAVRHEPPSPWPPGAPLCIIALAAVALFAACAPALAAGELSLADAIQKALVFAPSAQAAVATADLGAAQVREAEAPFYPAVSGNIDYYQPTGFSRTITNGGQSDTLLGLSYTAYDFGRRLAALHASQYAQEAKRFGLSAVRAQIVFDTSVAYFDLLRKQAATRELQRSLDRLQRYVTIVRALRRTGRAIANDVLKVETSRDSTELAAEQARQAERQASVTLGSLIGSPESTDLQVAEVSGPAQRPSGSLDRNPMLLAAERSIQSARQQVRLAEAAQYPVFTLDLAAGYLGINPPYTFNHNLGASYDTSVSLPIFQGGAMLARIDQAKARQHQAEAAARAVKIALEHRLADSRLRYNEAQRQLTLVARSEPTADAAFALDWTRFLGGGSVTLLEVLVAYQQAEQFRLRRFDLDFEQRQAAADMNLVYGAAP